MLIAAFPMPVFGDGDEAVNESIEILDNVGVQIPHHLNGKLAEDIVVVLDVIAGTILESVHDKRILLLIKIGLQLLEVLGYGNKFRGHLLVDSLSMEIVETVDIAPERLDILVVLLHVVSILELVFQFFAPFGEYSENGMIFNDQVLIEYLMLKKQLYAFPYLPADAIIRERSHFLSILVVLPLQQTPFLDMTVLVVQYVEVRLIGHPLLILHTFKEVNHKLLEIFVIG